MSDTTSYSTTPMADSVKPSPQDMNLQSLTDKLDHYAREMAPGKPIDAATGATHQLGLWRAIQFVLQREGSEFNALWDALLTFARVNRQGVFNERLINRFHESIKLSTSDRQCFQRLLTLIMRTCDPASRALVLKQIDFQTILAKIVDNNVRMRITGYYRV